MKTIKFNQECPMCEGYGVITQKQEVEIFGTICSACYGKGYIQNNIQYKKFTKLKINNKLNRIFPIGSPIISGLDYHLGISYQDWLDGKSFQENSEPRNSCCPTQWKRFTDPANCPEWIECENYWKKRTLDSCEFYKDKEKCWKRYDKGKEIDL